MIRAWAAVVVVLALALPGCAPVPDDIGSTTQATGTLRIDGGPFPLLDAGASQLDSLHLRVLAYGPENARQISEQAEASYSRIMVDTNLFSFHPSELYQIVVYASADEYRAKTRMPFWSGGVTVRNSIYTFQGPGLQQTVAHEMTHVIFHEFMGDAIVQNNDYRWINEGLAVYEQQKAAVAGGFQGDIFGSVRPLVRAQPLTMDVIVHFVPGGPQEDTINQQEQDKIRQQVTIWYAQSEGMIRHMLERGGTLGFSTLLTTIRDGGTTDQALAQAYGGTFNGLNGFYQSWQQHQ